MRLLAGLRTDGSLTLAEHHALHGPLPHAGRELIEIVEAACLRGRGGANFPAAVKLRAVASGRRPIVVVTTTEVSTNPPEVLMFASANRVLPLHRLVMFTRVCSALLRARTRSAIARA